jgi:hypothetical protein
MLSCVSTHPVLHPGILKPNQQVEEMKFWKQTGEKFEPGGQSGQMKEEQGQGPAAVTRAHGVEGWELVHNGIVPVWSNVDNQLCFTSSE